MTNEKLYQIIEEGNPIPAEVLDVLLELDSTASASTQTELHKLLVKLYDRLDKEEIVVEKFGDGPCAPVALKNWVEKEMDDHTIDRFLKDIKKK